MNVLDLEFWQVEYMDSPGTRMAEDDCRGDGVIRF